MLVLVLVLFPSDWVVAVESISCPTTDNEKIMASQKIPIIIIIGFVNEFGGSGLLVDRGGSGLIIESLAVDFEIELSEA